MFYNNISHILHYIYIMYTINNEHYCGNVLEIATKYGAPYRRMLTELKKYGNTQFRSGGEVYIIKKLTKL